MYSRVTSDRSYPDRARQFLAGLWSSLLRVPVCWVFLPRRCCARQPCDDAGNYAAGVVPATRPGWVAFAGTMPHAELLGVPDQAVSPDCLLHLPALSAKPVRSSRGLGTEGGELWCDSARRLKQEINTVGSIRLSPTCRTLAGFCRRSASPISKHSPGVHLRFPSRPRASRILNSGVNDESSDPKQATGDEHETVATPPNYSF